MKNINKIKLSKSATIKEALKVIGEGAIKLAIVVDDNDRLIGTLSDGDIRRGLLEGLGLNNPIKSLIVKEPIVIKNNESKEKILKLAISKKIHHIPVVDDKGALIKLEEVNYPEIPDKKNNKVILMVGGLGTRLGNLTKNTPKPMLKVGDKSILQTIVERFTNYGYTNITMCLNYKSHIIQDYFGDGSKFGINLDYILEKERLGTAGALSLIKENPVDPFFVMNGDILTDANIEDIHNSYVSSNADALMCVREYNYQVPYGVVETSNNAIASIEEKPTQKFFVNAGIYMLSPKVLEYIPQNEFFNMTTLFEKLIDKDMNVISYPLNGYWLDIGRFEEFKRANDDFDQVF
tara:strand:- start:524 stop:1570 length:1047 start_codon:yes stop_codon:yes gene_type:complete